MGIIIFGASGAGSTTLGKETAQRLNFHYLDIDDYLWHWDTPIPFTAVRPREERAQHLMDDIKNHPDFVIAGTIFNDRALFEPLLELAVFVSTPADVCAERVWNREHARWGERVRPGGDMYKNTRFHGDFDDYMANAHKYETAAVENFGRKLHEAWIAELTCPVLRIDGANAISANVNLVVTNYADLHKQKNPSRR